MPRDLFADQAAPAAPAAPSSQPRDLFAGRKAPPGAAPEVKPPVPTVTAADYRDEQAFIKRVLATQPHKAPEIPKDTAAADPRMDPFWVPPEAKDNTGRVFQAFTDWPIETKRDFLLASQQGSEGIDNFFKARGMLAKGLGALEFIGAGFNEGLAPLKAFARTGFGDPAERSLHAPGLSRAIGESFGDTVQFFATPPTVKAAGKASSAFGASKTGEGIKAAFSPTSSEAGLTVDIIEGRGKGRTVTTMSQAKAAAAYVRARAGELARAREMVATAMENMRKDIAQLPDGTIVFDSTGKVGAPKGSKLDFIDAIETDDVARLPPEQQAVAGKLREMLDEWRDKIRGLGKGYLESYNENYFPHIWKDPSKAAAMGDLLDAHAAQLSSKSTLKGRAAFLKQRSVGSFLLGLGRGLEPITMNPLDLSMLKLWEMQKFYYGHLMLEDMKEAGLVKFGRSAKDAGEGMRPLEGREFNVFAPAAKAEARVFDKTNAMIVKDLGESEEARGLGPQAVGRFWASEPVARILHNYLSSGWRGNGIYDGIRHAGNALNQMQLAWPGFHSLFVTVDTFFSEIARGIDRGFHGEFGRGLSSIVQSPISVAKTIHKGSQVRRAYLFPNGAPPEAVRLSEALARGGGRVKMDEFWRAAESNTLLQSIRGGTLGRDILTEFKLNPVLAFPKLIAKTLDLAAYPIMDFMVPRAKIGVFSNLAEDWLRRNPGASQMQLTNEMQLIWDSVDNRLGQMVYDNIFWHKSLKDAAFLGMRSVGWNLGTVREIGGGAVDTAKAAHDMMTGANPRLTYRMSYTMALPFGTAMLGGMLTYLMTGHGPQRMMDYFFPPTGGVTPNGGDERVNIPSYMKDVAEYNLQPGQTLLNKLHPAFETGVELYQNRDYYGALIADPDTPGYDQLTDYLKYFGAQAEPFSLRSFFRLENEPGSAISPFVAGLGLNPAPAYITDPERGEMVQRRQDKIARKRKMRKEE